ncbi:MarR family winged helix-turn-helix transcriptional regulator [Paenibacillus sp. PAMC21692]|uniref:MarR family winged helix-turn-helix transcriptional regulator n=1 Tax=Paenibacillus sp. PAMC21692 TaxID=2762320 RepID=UPI0021C434A3|nr:MarR family transcriptional regulator [Paenibacillus sp. PAMC21692]
MLMSVLADRLNVTKGAVTQIITRLEHKQLVQRNPNPADSRSVLVFMTETGLKALLVHDEMQEAMYRELSANLDDNEMKILEKGLETLCRHLQRD